MTHDEISSDKFINFSVWRTAFDSDDAAVAAALDTLSGGGVLHFSSGIFTFTNTLQIPSGVSLTGAGAPETELVFDLAAPGHAFHIAGSQAADLSFLTATALRRQHFVTVENAASFGVNDYVKIGLEDSDLVTSEWAYNSVGQIVKITDIEADTLFLASETRLDYTLEREAYVQKINPVQDVHFSCFKITNNTVTTSQTSNFAFDYAVDCSVKNTESDKCNFAHIAVYRSAHLTFAGNYLHHAHDYGGGGRAYGTALQLMTSDCLIENNIFEHLRHSVLLQAGANGNVIADNYSFDPFWTGTMFPANAAGDLVLHGNYTFANLFEGNTAQNIVIDDSHGKNGPGNTFFRNRTEGYGIFMNQNPATDSVNFVGNEILNGGLFYLNGAGHYIYGNNVQGNFPADEQHLLTENSLFRSEEPTYFAAHNALYPTVGLPAAAGERLLPAQARFNLEIPILGCGAELSPQDPIQTATEEAITNFSVFPNPTTGIVHIENAAQNLTSFAIIDLSGIVKMSAVLMSGEARIDISDLSAGIYILSLRNAEGEIAQRKIVKL